MPWVRKASGVGAFMHPERLRRQLYRAKGARVAALRGKAHRWTPEEARKANLKAQRRLYGRLVRGKPIGGRSIKHRPPVPRPPLRLAYCGPRQGIWFAGYTRDGTMKRNTAIWYETCGRQSRQISEQAALQRLGYLPRYGKSGRIRFSPPLPPLDFEALRVKKPKRRKSKDERFKRRRRRGPDGVLR